MSTRLILAALVALTLSACGHYDPGGYVHEYVARKHEPRLIDYPCYSACTVYLQSPLTCYTPGATFHFHGVTPHSPADNRLFMARFWPEMRAHLIEARAVETPGRWYVMTGAQVAALDTIERECLQHPQT